MDAIVSSPRYVVSRTSSWLASVDVVNIHDGLVERRDWSVAPVVAVVTRRERDVNITCLIALQQSSLLYVNEYV